MIRILLIRHGATDAMQHVLCGRMPGVSLNPLGVRQANRLANGLREDFHIDEVISSPLERTLETATIIAEKFGKSIQVNTAWIEMDYGDWTGQTFEKIRSLDSWIRYDRLRSTTAAPAGESLMQVQERAVNSFHHVVSRGGGNGTTVAIVSHGDVIRALLASVLAMPLNHLHRLEIAPASVSEIAFDQSYKVSRLNCIYSLSGNNRE